VQAAFNALSRAEVSLAGLVRSVQQSGGDDQLIEQLVRVRETLSLAHEHKVALRNEFENLLQERESLLRDVEEARAEAARERAFLIQEQDKFIKMLVEDHQHALGRALQERDEAMARSGAPPAEPPDQTPFFNKLLQERAQSLALLRRLQAQRDELQGFADRLEQERDDARARITDLVMRDPGSLPEPDDVRSRATEPPAPSVLPLLDRARGTTPPVAPALSRSNSAPTARPPSFRRTPPGGVGFGPASPPSSGSGPAPASPRGPSLRLSPPPVELAAAVTPLSNRDTQPVRPRPDPTQRPLGSYSIRPSAEVELVKGGSKPPRR
jgi:hypothetical protein